MLVLLKAATDWQGVQQKLTALAASAAEHLPLLAAWASLPWVRIGGLAVLVLITIWLIAWVYAGSMSNSEYGPVGIRPHVAKRLEKTDIVVPKHLVEANVDGVIATCDIYYAYNDREGMRRRVRVKTIRHATLHLSPLKLGKHGEAIFGHEIPDVETANVCFPPTDVEETPNVVGATPERARDYAALHKIIDNWKEDDEALLVSLSSETLNEIATYREDYLTKAAARAARERERPRLARFVGKSLARLTGDRRGKRQPNVVGNYMLRFRFSKSPFFILTRHPDRELKMTAWLTVLTSAFALVMDYWPKNPTPDPSATQHSTTDSAAPLRARR